jgi:iron-sulfur cluster assembly accessory protein
MGEIKMATLQQPENPVVTLTDLAAKKVSDILKQHNKPDYGLRIFVRGGGCSGLSYGMTVEKEPTQDDYVLEQKGVKVFVDKFSADYIRGSTVDYVETIESSGFKVDNPNAVQSCGCGHSFRTTERPGTPHKCNC